MKNSLKADILFKVATEKLNLSIDERKVPQFRPMEYSNCGSPYICDGVGAVMLDSGFYTDDMIFHLTEELRLSGMERKGFGVFSHVQEGYRQEARWFFLMLIVEFLDQEGD